MPAYLAIPMASKRSLPAALFERRISMGSALATLLADARIAAPAALLLKSNW
jgi:hypothetical protein